MSYTCKTNVRGDLHLISSKQWHAETCPLLTTWCQAFSLILCNKEALVRTRLKHSSWDSRVHVCNWKIERERETVWIELETYLIDAPQVRSSSVLRSMLGSKSWGNSSSSSFVLQSSLAHVSASATGLRLWCGGSTSVWTTPFSALVDFSVSGLTFSLWTSACQTQERLLIARGISDLWHII